MRFLNKFTITEEDRQNTLVIVLNQPTANTPPEQTHITHVARPLRKHVPKKRIPPPEYVANFGGWPVTLTRYYQKKISHWIKDGNTPPDAAYWQMLAASFQIENYDGTTEYTDTPNFFRNYQRRQLQGRGYTWLPNPPAPAPTPTFPLLTHAAPLPPLINSVYAGTDHELSINVTLGDPPIGYSIATWWQWQPRHGPTSRKSPRYQGVTTSFPIGTSTMDCEVAYPMVIKWRPPGTRGRIYAFAWEGFWRRFSPIVSIDFTVPQNP